MLCHAVRGITQSFISTIAIPTELRMNEGGKTAYFVYRTTATVSCKFFVNKKTVFDFPKLLPCSVFLDIHQTPAGMFSS